MSIDNKKPEGPTGQSINNAIAAGQRRSKLLQSESLKKEYRDLGAIAYWKKYGGIK